MIYLASQSPRRKEILKKMRVPFKVVSSSYHEKPKKISPSKLVLEHAVGKVKGARWSSPGSRVLKSNTVDSRLKHAGMSKKKKRHDGYILGADTLVYSSGKILGKPKSLKQAYQMLSRISGRAHSVYTGVAVLNLSTGKLKKAYAKTKVFIKKLGHEEKENYLKKISPFDKAGAYAIQMKPKIVVRVEGSYSNVVGLPVELVKRMVTRAQGHKRTRRK